MDSYGEDAEINDGRHHPLRNNEEHDDEFSMSSYDGEQTDSLIIKPPQAVALHRDKKEKREKRDRHRHKGERHKDRHRNRERAAGHEERRREHRRHRERDPERREAKRHEKHRERSGMKHERLAGDLRNKLLEKDRKLNEREQMRVRERVREREEYYMDDRDLYDPRPREHMRAGSQLMHHRERRQEDHSNFGPPSLMGLDLSPREKTEREKRMERFMLAEKQKEITQREADVRRQRREEERREEKRMEELRQRAEESMLRNAGKNLSSSERSKKKKRKHAALKEAEPETVELISDDDEQEKESDEEMEEEEEEEEEVEEETNYEVKKRRHDQQEIDEVEEDKEQQNRTPRSASSGPTSVALNSPTTTSPQKSLSHSDSSSSTSSGEDEDDEDDDEDDDNENDEDDDANENKEMTKNGAIPIPAKKTSRSDTRSGSGTSSDEDSTDQEKKDDSDNDSPDKKGNYLDFSPVASPPEMKEQLPSYYPAIMGCRSVDEFECLNRIEEGTYGVVYRAREKSTNQIVALKRLKMEKEKEGFPITSLREVNTLLKGQHDNIVTVREIVVGSNMDKIYIVMDYVEHDLKSLMETMRKKKQSFTIGEGKTLMIQLLRAVHHLHDNWILHRDLKTSNLLLSHRGILKVGDFGLAREYGSPLKQYTPIVVTLWYRAPELLLGTKEYSCPIDVWSVGCIFGELLGMEPMFPGKSEIDQLNKIFKDLGTPSDKIWPGYSQMPVIKKTQFAYYPYNHLKERFKTRLSTEGFKLLNSFLTYNPAKRITCSEAMTHDYFYKEEPAPIDPAMFPTWPAKSELPHGGRKKGVSPKPPSGGKDFKALGDGEDESIAGFFLGGAPLDGPGFTLKF